MDIEKLRKLISYNPQTGSMKWKPRPASYFKSHRGYSIWTARYCGKEVGCIHTMKCGYTCRVFSLQDYGPGSSRIFCHRAAWAIMTGSQPPAKIDHINQDATDNRWKNLRDGTGSINEKNAFLSRANKTGVPGVRWNKQRGKWEVYVTSGGKKINLGLHDDIEKAKSIAINARREMGFSPLHGRCRPTR